MYKTKKLFCFLMVIAILITTLGISAINANGAAAVYAHKFAYNLQKDYNYGPGDFTCNQGILRMQSGVTKYQKQHQMLFAVDKTMMKNAVSVANNNSHDGTLQINVSLDSCIGPDGKASSAEIVVRLLDSAQKVVAQAGSYQQPRTNNIYLLDVQGENAPDTSFVYICIQNYSYNPAVEKATGNYGCAGIDAYFSPITVYDAGSTIATLPIKTNPVDPNQKTFFKYCASSRMDYNNAPSTLRYSGDGATYVSEATAKSEPTGKYNGFIEVKSINCVEQMQMKHSFADVQSEAENALAIVNAPGGSHKVKMDLTIASCKDNKNEDTVAEVMLHLYTKAKNSTSTAPAPILVQAWQYPGTTRTYYIDLSTITTVSELDYFVVRVQNYWFYNEKHQLVDLHSNYEEAAKLGYTSASIAAKVVLSPMTVVKSGEYCTNVDYKYSLDGYNKDGKIPADKSDPTVGTSSTKTTAAIKLATPKIASTALTAKTTSKITWNKVTNATAYDVYRSIGNSSSYKKIASVKSNYYYNDKLSGGTKYNYKIVATRGTIRSGYSYPKSITTMKYTAVVSVKSLSSAKKAFTVKRNCTVTGARGYEVQYSLKSNFKSAKIKSFTGSSKKITSLKAKKKYYVRVRAYNTVNGKKTVSKWSKSKTVKVK